MSQMMALASTKLRFLGHILGAAPVALIGETALPTCLRPSNRTMLGPRSEYNSIGKVAQMALKLVNLSPSPNPQQAQIHFIDEELGVEGPSLLVFVPFLPDETQTQEEIISTVKAAARRVVEEALALL